MTTTATESRPELEAIIARRLAETGGIPFAEFMALCLYHPQYGYYMAPRSRIGREGDFFTSSSVHALFGRLIARQLRQRIPPRAFSCSSRDSRPARMSELLPQPESP